MDGEICIMTFESWGLSWGSGFLGARSEMEEESYKERVLETWPCGCRKWYTRTMVGEVIEQQDLTRSEICCGLDTLVERETEAEGRMIYAYTEHGEHSPEYKQAASVHADVHAKIEKHCNNSMPTVEVLGAE